jgi:hypothetical protein
MKNDMKDNFKRIENTIEDKTKQNANGRNQSFSANI